MTVTPLEGLPEVRLIQPKVFKDTRGFFLETYNESTYRAAGINARFVQDNHSRSTRHTLRGLHAQLKYPQAKLVRAVQGAILDVVVDIRRGSPTYKRWAAVELSSDNFAQIYVPRGYAHGFYTLSDVAEVEYKCTDFYHPEDELHLLWNDPEIGIAWPGNSPVLSGKDAKAQPLAQLQDVLPVYPGPAETQ